MLEIEIHDQSDPRETDALEEFKSIATQDFIERLADEQYVYQQPIDGTEKIIARLSQLSRVFGNSDLLDTSDPTGGIKLIVQDAIKLRDSALFNQLADYHHRPETIHFKAYYSDFYSKIQKLAKNKVRPALRIVA